MSKKGKSGRGVWWERAAQLLGKHNLWGKGVPEWLVKMRSPVPSFKNQELFWTQWKTLDITLDAPSEAYYKEMVNVTGGIKAERCTLPGEILDREKATGKSLRVENGTSTQEKSICSPTKKGRTLGRTHGLPQDVGLGLKSASPRP